MRSNNTLRYLVACLLGVFLVVSLPVQSTAENGTKYDGPRFEGSLSENSLDLLETVEKGLNQAARKARPAVVTVFVEKKINRNRGFPFRFRSPRQPRRQRKVRGLGSGVIIRSNGYIVTNHHVIEGMTDIKVLLPNQEKVDARLVGADPKTDLAVLKINRTNLPELDFADSDRLKVGQWAIAIGSPFALENSVSYGHVSALERSIQATKYENFVQTDAPINRGNSGGPLVNIRGKIIGINTIIQTTSGGSQGVGFASASNLVKRTVTDLIEHGEVKRSWLGVTIQKLPGKVLEQHFGYDHGALVASVRPGSPADESGLKPGNLIIALGDRTIEGPADLQQAIIAHDIGEDVILRVVRDGKTETVTVTLGERPDPREQAKEQSTGSKLLAKLGLGLREISADQAREWGFDVDHPLVQVARLVRGSVAHRAGLRPEDVILSLNRETVTSLGSFKKNLSQLAAAGRDSLLLLIRRDQQRLYVTVPLPKVK